MRTDNPGIWFPPPLWYALAILGGALLHRRWPLPLASGRLTIVAGGLLVAAWLVVALASVAQFRRAKTSVVPIRPANALVMSGPYRYTRNPMYLGLTLLTIACGCFLRTWWPIILLVPTLVLVERCVIVPEERYLRRRFGSEYDNYTRRVRRWL